jgi:glycosyltransferase involved in cell wall biosynthesis
MRVAVVSSAVPFIKGGARNIVDWLATELRRAGHEAEVVYLPFSDDPARLLSQHAAMRWVELDDADVVICIRAPAHLIRHPRKVVWFIHHIRYYYDLWDTPYRAFPADPVHVALRDTLRRIDTAALGEAHRLFTNSRTVAGRLQEYNDLDAEVLYPPLFEPERFTPGDYGDEILYVSRLEHHKRQHLAIQAMRHTRSPVRLRVAGVGQNPAYLAQLQEMVWRYGLDERVVIEAGWLDEKRKADLIGGALAVAYLPFDEDSYGYPSLEAAHAARPIVTTSDSGGVIEFVQDEVNGFVREPDAASLANAFDRLFEDRELAARLGAGARARVDELNVSWDHVLDRLLS